MARIIASTERITKDLLVHPIIKRNAALTYDAYKRDYRLGLHDTTESDVRIAKNKLIRAITSQLISAGVLVIMGTAYAFLMHRIDGYKDKDKDAVTGASFWGKVLDDLMSNIIGSVTFGSNAYDFAKALITGQNYYGLSLNGVDTVVDLLQNVINIRQEKQEYNLVYDYWKLFKTVCEAAGIPARNIETIVEAGVRWTQDAINGEIGTYNSDWDAFGYTTSSEHRKQEYDAVRSSGNVKSAIERRIRGYISDGKSEKEANQLVQKEITAYCKQWYKEKGSIKKDILRFMVATGVYDDNKPKKKTLEQYINDNYLAKWALE